MHCVDLGESFPTSNYLLKSSSIQPRTSPSKFGGKFNSIFIRLLGGDVAAQSWTSCTNHHTLPQIAPSEIKGGKVEEPPVQGSISKVLGVVISVFPDLARDTRDIRGSRSIRVILTAQLAAEGAAQSGC